MFPPALTGQSIRRRQGRGINKRRGRQGEGNWSPHDWVTVQVEGNSPPHEDFFPSVLTMISFPPCLCIRLALSSSFPRHQNGLTNLLTNLLIPQQEEEGSPDQPANPQTRRREVLTFVPYSPILGEGRSVRSIIFPVRTGQSSIKMLHIIGPTILPPSLNRLLISPAPKILWAHIIVGPLK